MELGVGKFRGEVGLFESSRRTPHCEELLNEVDEMIIWPDHLGHDSDRPDLQNASLSLPSETKVSGEPGWQAQTGSRYRCRTVSMTKALLDSATSFPPLTISPSTEAVTGISDWELIALRTASATWAAVMFASQIDHDVAGCRRSGQRVGSSVDHVELEGHQRR